MNHQAITVKNLTKKFGEFLAVDNISFSVDKGDIFAFLGPNGAGKSTTIKMLTTLLHPTSGEILLDNINPLHDQDKARHTFGIVFQDPSLDEELTALENLEFHAALYSVPVNVRQKRIDELMSLVELTDRKNHLVKTFSGGMRRRLEIARGLLHHPKIFFLDEPTLGLDPQTRNQIWEYIQNLNKKEGTTVFFTTHYMEEANRIARNVAIIDHGRIIAQDTPAGLKKKTKTDSLEEAFLSLTGKSIRDQDATGIDNLRMRHQLWTKRS